MKLTVIIPIYNERDTCKGLIERVKRVPFETQIIVVDDGSTDGSSEILETIPGITLIQYPTNLGKGSAVRSAVPRATGDYIILQDGDLEYDPQDYPKLLEPLIQNEADVVFGSRWLGRTHSWTFHYWGNRLLTFFSNLVNRSRLTDMASCHKAIPTPLFRSLQLKSKGFGLEAEITAKLFRRGYRVEEIPVSYARRTKREGKKIRLKDGLVALWSCLYFRFFE